MVNETVDSIAQTMDWIREAKDRSVNSLTEYTKKTLISSRVYVEDTLAREEGISNIMKFINHIYGGLVFSAIGMNNLAVGGRTVRDMASMISTEDFNCFVDLVKNKFGEKNVKVSAGLEDRKDIQQTIDAINPNGPDSQAQKGKAGEAKDVKLEPGLFCGRLVEVNIAGKDGKNVPFYFYVQLCPYTTPTTVMEQFIANSYPPDKASRWAKFKAGEIKFWKDFIFECDLVAKRRKALKADKDGILREIEDRKMSSITKAVAAMNPFAARNHNSASSIILVSKRTINRLMKDNGLQYDRYDVRQKIMSSTMSMMMVVFDPNYNTVDLYMNGIQNVGKYSLEMVKEAVSKGSKDNIDLKQLMTLLGAGAAPRF